MSALSSVSLDAEVDDLAELGKLDEAEKKYQQGIAANANDTKAKAELQYVREQKAKPKAR